MHKPPFATVYKQYGEAFLELARERPEILCLSGDLTRQCEIDLFQEALPERFIHAGMAEANMVSMAGSLARQGFVPYVHTFGVFATRRPYDQIANAVSYPSLPVRLIGFMPGISSPGGPSHQAIDDIALMRALPNMTVIDVADANEVRQVPAAIADIPGPVYVRLKRGEVPVIFEEGHELSLARAQVVLDGSDVVFVATGMMLAVALSAAQALADADVSAGVINVTAIKPLDGATICAAAASARLVISAENHSIVGGLGSAVAEVMAEGGLGVPLRRIGLRDTFAEGAATREYLFRKYGLSTQDLIDAAWDGLGKGGAAPAPAAVETDADEYAPV